MLWAVFLGSGALTAFGCHTLATRAGLQTGLYFDDYLSLNVIPMAASCLYLLKSSHRPIFGTPRTKQIAALTMGIYLIHPLIIEILQRAGFGPLDFHPILAIAVVAVAAFAASLVSALVISRLPGMKKTI